MNYLQGGNTGDEGLSCCFLLTAQCACSPWCRPWCVATPPVSFGFALIVLCLPLQVEDRDYLEKVNGKLLSHLFPFNSRPKVTLKTFDISPPPPPQGSRAASSLTAGTLTSLGGTSSRRGSGETALTLDAETSLREIKVTETDRAPGEGAGLHCLLAL